MAERRSVLSFVVSIGILAVGGLVPGARAEEPTLDQRLQHLAEELEQARVDNHAPGMAIGVVRGNETVLLRGFGLADVDAERPVDADSRFAIGSTTKAMTAALIAQLVDQGQMGWDDPVREHVPGFRLSDPDVSEEVTIRDLLCHRVGLASLNALWYGTDATEQDIIDAVGRAELLFPFRQHFNYSNVSYMIAGRAAANAAGVDSWHTLVRERLLEPLKMDGATTLKAEATADPEQAIGYRWDEEEQSLGALPLRRLDVIAPAGAVNASAREMVNWLRLQLGRGVFNGERIVSEEALTETWKPLIDAFGVKYAMGWLVTEWEGHRLITHTGGIDGFTARVALLPDDDLGYVLLVNRGESGVSQLSEQIVFSAMLGDLGREEAGSDEEFSRFTGIYIANFGQFSNAEFKVSARDGRLAVDVPGQTVYELRAPDDEGKRAFAMSDDIQIRFNESDAGEVYSMTLFQAGYNLDLPREGVEQPLNPVDESAVQPYLGKYRFDALGVEVEILINERRLAIDVPGQTTYELEDPDEEGRWVFKIKDSIWVLFNKEEETGEVVSITLVQDGQESILPRVAEAPGEALPTVDALMSKMREARGGDAVDSLRSIRMDGEVHALHLGVSGAFSAAATRDGDARLVTDLGVFGTTTIVITSDRVWLDGPQVLDHEPAAEEADAIRFDVPLRWLSDWREFAEDVGVEQRTTFDDREALRVRVETKAGAEIVWYVDAETFLPIARRETVGGAGASIETTTHFADYSPEGGVVLAHRITKESPVAGEIEIRYTSVEVNPDFGAGTFSIPGS